MQRSVAYHPVRVYDVLFLPEMPEEEAAALKVHGVTINALPMMVSTTAISVDARGVALDV